MAETQKRQREIEICDYRGERGYLAPAKMVVFVRLRDMEVSYVPASEIKTTGQRATLEWEEPL